MFHAQSNVKDQVIRARHRSIPTKVHILIHYYILNIHIPPLRIEDIWGK